MKKGFRGGIGIQMKGLRIKLLGEPTNLARVERVQFTFESLAYD